MKVLFVSPTPTHPSNAGNRKRILAMATALRERGAELTLLYYAREGLDFESYTQMKAFWDDVHLVLTGSMYTQPPADHFKIDDWITRSVSEAFLSLTRLKQFDCVIINYVMLSSLAELTSRETLTVLDTHDVFAGRDDMLREIGRKPDFFWTSPEEEAKGLSRFDVVIAIQAREATYFAASATKVIIVGHLDDGVSLAPRERDAERIVYGVIGSRNQVNSKFIGDLAKAWANSASGILRIYGAICEDPYVREAASASGQVELCGRVSDTATFYENIDVAVNPICAGTGLKIKTVEALAMGLPVISTEEGFAGLPSTDTFHQLRDLQTLVEYCNLYSNDESFRDVVNRSSHSVCEAYQNSVSSQINELVALIKSCS